KKMQIVLDQRICNLTLVVERVYDPFNASAIIRTAEAFGLNDIYFINSSKALEPVKEITISADKWIDITEFSTVSRCYEHLTKNGFTQVPTLPPSPRCLQGSIITEDFKNISPDFPLAIWFGNERDGLTADTLKLFDSAITIPMTGFSQSINLSNSVALIMYHFSSIYRQTKQTGDLSPSVKKYKYASFLLQDLEYSREILKEVLSRNNKHQ
ncbi:MAG: RNA methyltransferase, partial [Deltaproteobacteria bacterium]|nr:RNA methyltransferase [Deltaproteobacteria bacterium]